MRNFCYLMPMHIECKRQANTISFQSRSDLPSHPVTSLSPICKYCSCGSLVALLNRLASVSSHQVPPTPKLVWTASHSTSAPADWWVTHPKCFFSQPSPSQVASSIDFAASETAAQSVFCQLADKLGSVNICTMVLSGMGPRLRL